MYVHILNFKIQDIYEENRGKGTLETSPQVLYCVLFVRNCGITKIMSDMIDG